jgi:long-chain acyl-CoA synthetase
VVKHLFKNVIERTNADLSRYEQIKRCKLLTRELTQEEGELTPTLKVKRRVIMKKYADFIEALYAPSTNGKETECQ